MGVPIDELEYGANCAIGAGGPEPLWDIDKTPLFVYFMLYSVNNCGGACLIAGDPPNGRMFEIEQLGMMHCRWMDVIDGYQCIWDLSAAGPAGVDSWVYNVKFPNPNFLDGTVNASSAQPQVSNDNVCGMGVVCGAGGGALIEWTARLQMFVSEYHLQPPKETMWDMYYIPNEPGYKRVYSLRNQKTPTNIKIKFDWTEKDQYDMFNA